MSIVALCFLWVYRFEFINSDSLRKHHFDSADDVLKATAVDKLPNDMEGMELTLERLLTLINDVYKYVDSVVVSFCYTL